MTTLWEGIFQDNLTSAESMRCSRTMSVGTEFVLQRCCVAVTDEWKDLLLLSPCLCPEPLRRWLLLPLPYSLLSSDDSAPFATPLASTHSNRLSSGGGSGGGGRSEIGEGKEERS